MVSVEVVARHYDMTVREAGSSHFVFLHAESEIALHRASLPAANSSREFRGACAHIVRSRPAWMRNSALLSVLITCFSFPFHIY